MKKGKMIWMAVIAALVLVPAMGWAQAKTPTSMAATEGSFMVEIYAGGGAASQNSSFIRDAKILGIPFTADLPGGIDPYVVGGMKFGYWFTPYGTYAIAGMPDWMKYFGFYTDISYHKLNFSDQRGTISVGGVKIGNVGFDTNGSLVTWAFMFAARYGFLPDSAVPFGRLQPYLAVGPAILFTNQDPTLNVRVGAANFGLSPASKDSTNVGIAVETGLRYFFNKSISAEASFKYRYTSFRGSYAGAIPGTVLVYNYDTKADFNLFSGQVGVAYHF
jgi:opacity protein-like surface antigen